MVGAAMCMSMDWTPFCVEGVYRVIQHWPRPALWAYTIQTFVVAGVFV
jgi:hypothetical protein